MRSDAPLAYNSRSLLQVREGRRRPMGAEVEAQGFLGFERAVEAVASPVPAAFQQVARERQVGEHEGCRQRQEDVRDGGGVAVDDHGIAGDRQVEVRGEDVHGQVEAGVGWRGIVAAEVVDAWRRVVERPCGDAYDGDGGSPSDCPRLGREPTPQRCWRCRDEVRGYQQECADRRPVEDRRQAATFAPGCSRSCPTRRVPGRRSAATDARTPGSRSRRARSSQHRPAGGSASRPAGTRPSAARCSVFQPRLT